MVCLHVDAAEVRKPDEEIMLGVVIIFAHGDIEQCLLQCGGECLFIVCFRTFGDILIFPFQFPATCLYKLCGQNFLSCLLCRRIFHGHDVILFVHEVRRDGKRKKLAFCHCLGNGIVEIFAGCEKFVVPNGDIAAKLVFMNEPHQFLRIFSILFAIAEENVGIKRAADLLRKLVPDQNGRKILRQLFIVGDRGQITAVGV